MIKKISIALIAIIAVFGFAPAQAAEQESIVVIDSYFDPSLVEGDVLHVCVVSQVMCSRVDQPRTASQFKSFNHGTIMADVVRTNNPGAKLILIRAANVAHSVVTPVTFLSAINWVSENRDLYNITKVSFSYNVGNGTTCKPAAVGVPVDQLHSQIVNTVSKLGTQGTRVFAAAGNHSSPKVDYPACISEVVSVGSALYRGSAPFSDILIGPNAFRSNVLKSTVATLQDSHAISRNGKFQLIVGGTTSVATAIAAATN